MFYLRAGAFGLAGDLAFTAAAHPAALDFASAARPAAEPSEERREGSGKQQPDQRAGNVDAHIPERRASSKGKALMEQWGLTDNYAGVACCILGYPEGELPEAKPRKDGYVVRV